MGWARSSPSVLVYDPNPVNPYGLNLALALGTGRRVLLARPGDSVGADRARAVAELSLGAYRTLNAMERFVSRVRGPLRALIAALRANVAVVVWIRDPWDAILFVLLSFARPVIVVDHNPTATRSQTGLRGWLLNRLRARATTRVVHTTWLSGAGECTVAPHPLYRSYRTVPVNTKGPARPPTVGFVGAIRADKGGSDLPALLGSLGDLPVRIIGGPSNLPASLSKLSNVTSTGQLDEDSFVRELRSVDAIVLPYSDATFSGALMAAFSVGTPALSYAHPSMNALLTAQSQSSPNPSALATLTREFIRKGWNTYRHTTTEWDSAVQATWNSILDSYLA